ncbi:MAG: Mth938-like domain-containing protein [Pseudomonadota bacterium]
MKLHLSDMSGINRITGHGPDHVLVNGQRHEGGLIVLPDEVVTGWALAFSDLAAIHFDALLIRAPEIVLLGSGHRLRFPPPGLYASLIGARIGVEVMDSAAACRTYNILAAEGRRVAAALLPG